MGAIFTESNSGISQVGPKTVARGLKTFLDNPGSLAIQSFAEWLVKEVEGLELADVITQMGTVVACFAEMALYYDSEARMVRLTGEVVEETCDTTIEHSAAKRDPRMRTAFSEEEGRKLKKFQSSNLACKSYIEEATSPFAELPEGKGDLSVLTLAQLKDFVGAWRVARP